MTQIQSYRETHAAQIIDELVAFVRQPNNVYQVDHIQRNASHLQAMLQRRGIHAELWPTSSGRPIVYGELLVPGAQRTLLVYSHFDGVPVEPERWHSDPYEPVLRTHLPADDGDWSTIPFPTDGRYDPSWRLFARSAADSKNATVAMLAAIDAIRANGRQPGVNIKFLFDGEEELESPCLPSTLAAYKHRLTADLMISACGERHQSGHPTVALGVRGILMFDMTVYTTTAAMHSGHFGNFAPSAAFKLAELLSTLKGADGQVAVPGFYESATTLTDSELAAIERVPAIEAQVSERFGIAAPEISGHSLQELINMPSMNVRGLVSGFVGESARNIVPHQAIADVDVRLVQGMDPDATLCCISRFIRDQGWLVLDREPTLAERQQHSRIVRVRKRAGFPAVRTPLDLPIAADVIAALSAAAAEPLVIMPTEGGSLPMHLFTDIGLPYISVPPSNYDCNQHTDDENLELRCLFEAVDLFAALFLMDVRQ